MLRKLSVDTIFNYRSKNDSDPKLYNASLYRLAKVIDNRIDLKPYLTYLSTISPKALSIGASLSQYSDNIVLNCIKSHYLYRTGGFTNFIPSRPLLDVLAKIKIDLPCSSVEIGKKHYYELGGYLGVDYVILNTEIDFNGDKVIRICITEKANETDCTYLGLILKEDENLIDSISTKDFTVPVIKDDGEIVIEKTDLKEYLGLVLQLVVNLFIYTSNPNEDFRAKFNQFSKNSKIANKEKLEYTQKSFVEIGFDAEFLRLQTVEKGAVRGFFRWQPCGIGRLQRKLTWINPHERNYKKYLD
jgi:hypothetical protein